MTSACGQLTERGVAGVDKFNLKLLSSQAETTWKDGSKVMKYYQEAMKGQTADKRKQARAVQLPDLTTLNDSKREEYRKWTPFADVWDVRL